MGTAHPRRRPSGRDGGSPHDRPVDANPAPRLNPQASAENSERHPLWVALGLLHDDAPSEIMSAPESWPRWAVLLPHVLAATARLDPATADDTAVLDDTAWLLDRAGTYLQVHARLTEARPLFERALAITEAAHGPDHPDVAARLNNLALVLRDLGRPQDARPLYERALAIDEAAYGPDHPDVATDLNNLATVLQDLGQPQDARPLEERASAIAKSRQSSRPAPADREV
jgi:tetratricopeptide (TPR) repeat protein